MSVIVPKLASNSVRGPGVGVKGLGVGLFAAAFSALLTYAVADAQGPSDAQAPADQTISAEVIEPAAVIKMSDDAPMYQPDNVIIHAGDTVEWKNSGMVSHSATDDPAKATKPDNALLPHEAKPFSSGGVMPGATYRYTFMVPGRYRYFCLSHEADKMVGEVIVEPRTQTAARQRSIRPAPPQQTAVDPPAVEQTNPPRPHRGDSQPWRNWDRLSRDQPD
jgi:plastocyanin